MAKIWHLVTEQDKFIYFNQITSHILHVKTLGCDVITVEEGNRLEQFPFLRFQRLEIDVFPIAFYLIYLHCLVKLIGGNHVDFILPFAVPPPANVGVTFALNCLFTEVTLKDDAGESGVIPLYQATQLVISPDFYYMGIFENEAEPKGEEIVAYHV